MKSKLATLLLCLVFGVYGAHRFYVGKISSGILYLCTAGLFGIGVIIDLFDIIFNKFTDKDGNALFDDMTSVNSNKPNNSNNLNNSNGNASSVTSTPKVEIKYIPVTVNQLYCELHDNIIRAKRTFQNNCVVIHGKLISIDSNEQYISIADSNNNCGFNILLCYIKNKEQINKIMKLNVRDNITIYCKIINVDKKLGYSANIIDIQ